MTTNLLLWIVAFPIAAAALAPIVAFGFDRFPRVLLGYFVIAHSVVVGLLVLALRTTASGRTLSVQTGRSDLPITLGLDHPAGVALLAVAILFLAVGAFSSSF